MKALELWRSAFADLDHQSPWPGPRPLSKDRDAERRHLLAGRDRDQRLFVEEVSSHSLVVLHGDSGVGKSSLLNVGLVPTLRANGYLPVVAWDWTNATGREGTPDELITELLRSDSRTQLPGIDLTGGSGGLLAQLDDQYQDHAVLVLDQFEELIRYQPQRFRETVDWVLDINRQSRVRVVLSLRSEYLHHLKAIERGARPFSIARFELAPLQRPKAIEKVIKSANLEGQPPAITDGAAALLVKAWDELSLDSPERGLLQLQATLYALHSRAVDAGRQLVTEDDVTALAAESRGKSSLLAAGFDEAIGIKLDRCAEACEAGALPELLDAALIDGTRALVRRASSHLSSGGYKLVRDEWDLAQETLRRELDTLALEPGQAEAIFTALRGLDGSAGLDFLGASRADVESALAVGDGVSRLPRPSPTAPELAELGVDPAPWVSDPGDVSSGPVLGMSPGAVVIEELRRFVFAVEWLTAAQLARASAPGGGLTLLTLIHDGFSGALEHWVRRTSGGPGSTLVRLTAAEGERFSWLDADEPGRPRWPEFDGSHGTRHLVNLRWRNCQVSASLRRVVFVNCDFRGSRFVDCTFEGVVFVNCLLDGATFADCHIVGAAAPPGSAPPNRQDRELPSFVVQVPEAVVHTLNRYRESPVPATELLSLTSGVPAVPWTGSVTGSVAWEPHAGGLTMYGGRLSSLMIRRCTFADGGLLSLRHIAGSSLDIVEQAAGSVQVFDSTIRGLSMTRPVGDDPAAAGEVDMSISNSALADVWFGSGLTGLASIENCVVWQLMNVSDRSGFSVCIRGSRHHGVVNVDQIADSLAMPGYGEDGITEPDELRAAAGRMAYRTIPARQELELRRKVKPA